MERKLQGILILTLFWAGQAFGLNPLKFTGVNATIEGALQLHWASNPNEYYQIDYADSLADTNTGLTTWKFLYDDYPSQGTNTRWLDTGNYFIDQVAVHPSKSPARFYRIVLSGTNSAPAPFVSVTSPTNGFSATSNINVTVSASSIEPVILTKLYVDGQEMQEPSTTTNYVNNGTNYLLATYVLNTCEWPNGSHTLFATAECQSGPSGNHDIPAPLIGRATSSFVSVTNNNLITRVAFSQPFFMPEDGQTQVVSAVFAANVNWTLRVQNATTNTIRTATGSGGTMTFNWDGKGDGGDSLPVGNYAYLITAQTNGQLLIQGGGGVTANTNLPPVPGGSRMATISTEQGTTTIDWYPMSAQEAVDAGWGLYYLQPPPMPPVKVDGKWISWEDVYGQETLLPVPLPASEDALGSSSIRASGRSQLASTQYSGASSQSTRAPVRPPTAPTRGRAGFFGVAYDTYRGVANGYNLPPPVNGLPGIPTPPRVHLEGHSSSTSFNYPVLWGRIAEAYNFVTEMKRGNWSMSFDRYDDALSINDLKASGPNIFNSVKLGLLLLHGTYGTSQDFTANGSQQMYFPITSGPTAQYIRMSEMNFGSSDPNGLKWMAISACNSLYQLNWFDMQNNGVQPYNNNLHMLLGTASVSWTNPHIEAYWARYMTRGKIVFTPMTIQEAWFLAAQDAYAESGFNYTNTIFYAVAGDAACQDDMLQTNNVPSGNPFYTSLQVWPRP